MPNITQNINQLLQQIGQIAETCGRSGDQVQLLAVSKTCSAEAIREAWGAGLHRFGENYLQEALDKMTRLEDLAIEWHFIGPVQANKTRAIAGHFAWVHSVDREKIARRLSDQRPGHLPPLNICIQVNIDNEPGKAGVAPEQVAELALQVAALPRLRLRGLMAIPEPTTSIEKQRLPFFRLRQLLATLRGLAPELTELDTLSMGMSGDLAAAIAEGATLVRVGAAIFGARDRQT